MIVSTGQDGIMWRSSHVMVMTVAIAFPQTGHPGLRGSRQRRAPCHCCTPQRHLMSKVRSTTVLHGLVACICIKRQPAAEDTTYVGMPADSDRSGLPEALIKFLTGLCLPAGQGGSFFGPQYKVHGLLDLLMPTLPSPQRQGLPQGVPKCFVCTAAGTHCSQPVPDWQSDARQCLRQGSAGASQAVERNRAHHRRREQEARRQCQ